jgi:hypothetical protein
MTNLQFANDNGTILTNPVAVEPNQQLSTSLESSTDGVRLYSVPLNAEVQASLMGSVNVYATSVEEASSKAQAQMDAGTVDPDIEMEDAATGFITSYRDVIDYFGCVCEIMESDIEVLEDRCDPSDILDAEVELLQTTIHWDFEMQTKLKAFLQTIAEMQISAA